VSVLGDDNKKTVLNGYNTKKKAEELPDQIEVSGDAAELNLKSLKKWKAVAEDPTNKKKLDELADLVAQQASSIVKIYQGKKFK
jgi:predicted transcriptional regulator